MYNREERHIGRAGDCFSVDAKAAEYSKSRAGNDPQNVNLRAGDYYYEISPFRGLLLPV